MNHQTGKYIMIAGISIVAIGIIVYFFHNKFNWFGRLPRDIRVEKENFKFYFPIATMIIVSLLLTLILNIFKKL